MCVLCPSLDKKASSYKSSNVASNGHMNQLFHETKIMGEDLPSSVERDKDVAYLA